MVTQTANDSSSQVWIAESWLITFDGATVCRHQIPDESLRREAQQKISSGETLQGLFGTSVQKLECLRISSVAWIPAVQTVLIRFNWLRDPWWIVFDDTNAGERLFKAIGEKLPDHSEVIQTRTGPQDLAMDPGLAVGILLVLFALIAMIGGALEGAGNAPMPVFEWLFRLLGRAAGLVAVGVVGVIVLSSGVVALAVWFRNRPTKLVVRSHQSRKGQ